MTKFNRLDAEAFIKPQGRPRNSYLPEYREFLGAIPGGQGGELILEGPDKKATIKNRLNHAADLEGKKLRYIRTSADRVRFQVKE